MILSRSVVGFELLYIHISPKNVLKGEAAGTAQLINFGMHHSSLMLCVRVGIGGISARTNSGLGVSWHFSPLEVRFWISVL